MLFSLKLKRKGINLLFLTSKSTKLVAAYFSRCNVKCFSTNPENATDEQQITISDVTKKIKMPRNPELVPHKYIQHSPDGKMEFTQSALHHLRWMLQKDTLRQDMFLLGQPGPLRRRLAMQFLELTQRELEYISLSRDTSESDLKQRREIKNKTAIYFDQCAVRAAINGRILILDGIEHAERNVLPILNNLLENREMHLENKKFLMSSERYDKLLEKYTNEELQDRGLLRVSEDFRVIALGLPTQKYKGTPLDPPFRSRFQSRNITHFDFDEIITDLQQQVPNVTMDNLKSLVFFGLAIQSADNISNLPDFPLDNLHLVAKIMSFNSNFHVHDAITHLYPYEAMFKKEQKDRIQNLLDSFAIKNNKSQFVKRINATKLNDKKNTIQFEIDDITVQVPGGHRNCQEKTAKNYVELHHQQKTLAGMIQTFALGDICVIGQKGVGKMTLTNHLIDLLNQTVELMVLYEDMTSRDLIQQRITTTDGDTVWQDSPLVRAAKSGTVAVLSGLQRLHKNTVTVLQRLIHDRELTLCDGTTLLRHDRYDALIEKGFTKLQLTEKGVLRIHESFRLIALAEPINLSSTAQNWFTPEILSLFMFLEVRPLQKSEEFEIIQKLYGKVHDSVRKFVDLAHILRKSEDPILSNLAGILSTRQLLKIAKHIAAYPINSNDRDSFNSEYNIVENTFLTKFMPSLPRAALEGAIQSVGIKQVERRNSKRSISIDDDILRIGNTTMKLVATSEQTKVPSTLFYEMPQHLELLERLLQDFVIGEHLLLVGNQGVGKNKLIDKLLQLMNKPREYLQLHRDTTVHSLTVQSTLQDGQVVYEDSALVKAVKNGHILVIDEADKAPVNVTCILSTLVENGEMTLSDGRKIIASGKAAQVSDVNNAQNIIETHPDFRVIVLANRPGFPFLGNDFFASIGDAFSCHAIDNPSPESEIYLLQLYGPSVPKKTLTNLVNAFGELRSMADEGLLNYPYSTREVVNIVKHLEKFPNESMSELVGNVLDFDKYQPETLEQVTQVLSKHGLSIDAYAKNELYALRKRMEIQLTIQRKSGLDVSGPKYGKVDSKNEPHVGGNTWAGGTGGRDTAGLGGKGGPFRLDAGHKVHQLSDEEKNDVPEEVKKAAREMNRKAYAEKLKEIKMSAHDHNLYTQFSEPIRKQVQQLKAALDAMQTKSKERHWQKYQTQGELDDTRLLEGITGEKNIYRRRMEANPWTDYIQEKPNRFKMVVDVSGSMYRFNGYDGRLDRELEAVVMVMEAFQGYEKKIVYDIVGHSGEGWEIPFISTKCPPKSDKERFETIKMMHAHSQFCWAGDSTVKATKEAVKLLAEDEYYENSIVVVLSDANLYRYGIKVKDFAKALTNGEPKVKGYVIFIGSLSEEAEEINAQMPAGHSFICMDLTKLPQILKQIFTSSLM